MWWSGKLLLALSLALPRIGTQVFIEPGQSDAEIDGWFARMEECGMDICRIRMFEEYGPELFDKAFDAAERHGIKIFATLFPADPDRSIGGFKFPFTERHEREIADYIRRFVLHFKDRECLQGWVLLNEPGTEGVIPDRPYTQDAFRRWKESHPDTRSDAYAKLSDFDREAFLTDHTTGFLAWIAEQIRKYDTVHDLHVNNHQIFDNIAEYDFPAWRGFLTSLGASAHPSWHFSYFSRNAYSDAMAANCAIVRSGAGPLPFWITELQGGNNTYSARNAFCPTADEIRQWMWTGIASGIEGLMFWTLNPRAVGGEAGEWGLLNFRNLPSDRMEAASEVIRTMKARPEVFSGVKPADGSITLMYFRESLWAEAKVQLGDLHDAAYEGRHCGGVVKSLLGFYEMFLRKGMDATICEAREFDWQSAGFSGRTIILANQICIPSSFEEPLRNFVAKGGTLIAEGLTGWYDENMKCTFQTGFGLRDVFGTSLLECKCTPGDFKADIGSTVQNVHLWYGILEDGQPFSRHSFGRGKAVWIPSCIALGARRSGDYRSLFKLVSKDIPYGEDPVIKKAGTGITMLNFTSGGHRYSLVLNKGDRRERVALTSRPESVVYASKGARLSGRRLRTRPEECVIIRW